MAVHLIITVHGIRTFGQWQERLERLVLNAAPASDHIEFVNYKYGYFSVLAFIIPLFRWIVVRKFRATLLKLCAEYPGARVDLVGHSFGTHVIAWSIARLPASSSIGIHTIILSGSVLRAGFPWRDLLGHRVKRVINDCGTKDAILLLSQFAVLFTGMAGRTGFAGATSRIFRNRFSPLGHSGYFLDGSGAPSDDYMRSFWLPLLVSEDNIIEFDCRTPNAFEGFVTFLGNNAEPIKLCVYVAPFAFLSWWVYGLYLESNQQRIRAEQALERATHSANNLVFDVAEKFQDQKGIPQALIISILRSAEIVMGDLEGIGKVAPEAERALGSALIELSAMSRQQRDNVEAIRSARRAVDIFSRLRDSNQDDQDHKRDLAVAYDRLGDALAQAGDLTPAVAAYRNLLDLAGQLKADPESSQSSGAKELLAIANEKVANSTAAAQPVDALSLLRTSLALRKELVAKDPLPSQQRDLAVTLSRIADLQRATGDQEGATQSFKVSLEQLNKLLSLSPSNTVYLRDAAVVHENIGDMMRSQGKNEEALIHYQTDLQIMRDLTKSDPSHLGWKLDSLKSYFRIGEILSAAGELHAAKNNYETGLYVAKNIPAEVRDWRSISAFYERLCATDARLGDLGRSRIRAAEGTNFFERSLLSEPSQTRRFAQALNRESWYALLDGDYDAAVEKSTRAIQTDPETLDIYLNKLHALIFSGNIGEARDFFNELTNRFRADAQRIPSLLRQDLEELKALGMSVLVSEREQQALAAWDQ